MNNKAQRWAQGTITDPDCARVEWYANAAPCLQTPEEGSGPTGKGVQQETREWGTDVDDGALTKNADVDA